MNEAKRIARLFAVTEKSLFRIDGRLGYDRLTEAITRLANAIADYPGDSEPLWSLGEYGECSLSDLLVGAYWHYTEWHGGQWSPTYAALCAIGRVFEPGMTGPEPENPAYQQLEAAASGGPA